MLFEKELQSEERFNIDQGLINRPEARQLRVLYEMNAPKIRLADMQIKNTVVFFGSARILPKTVATRKVKDIEKELQSKESAELKRLLFSAKNELRMSKYYEDAAKLAAKITEWSFGIEEKEKRFYICSGGGPGIMEAANRGSHEAGGPSMGFNISLPFEQSPNPYQTKDISFEFHYFFIRKFWFAYLAKALVVFPGGYGTMDELFELLTLIQTRKIEKNLPIILYGKKFWNEIINFDAFLKWGLISEEDLDLFQIHNSVEESFEYLKQELTQHYLK